MKCVRRRWGAGTGTGRSRDVSGIEAWTSSTVSVASIRRKIMGAYFTFVRSRGSSSSHGEDDLDQEPERPEAARRPTLFVSTNAVMYPLSTTDPVECLAEDLATTVAATERPTSIRARKSDDVLRYSEFLWGAMFEAGQRHLYFVDVVFAEGMLSVGPRRFAYDGTKDELLDLTRSLFSTFFIDSTATGFRIAWRRLGAA